MPPQIKLPFSYGTIANPLIKPAGDNTHSWVAFVKFPTSIVEANIIKRVTFKLHESFRDPLRCILYACYFLLAIESFPFELKESGWGEFQMQIRIYFTNTDIKPVFLSHHLKLYSDNGSTGTVISENFDKICLDDIPETETLSNICKTIEISCTITLLNQ
jgi:YEATS domain-containing protein 4